MPKPYHTPKSERDEIVSALEISEALADLELAEIAVENTPAGSELAEYNRDALATRTARYNRARSHRLNLTSRSAPWIERG